MKIIRYDRHDKENKNDNRYAISNLIKLIMPKGLKIFTKNPNFSVYCLM